MVNYREILRLSALKHVQRDIYSAMHCSDHTVRAVLREAAKHNIHWPLDEDITNAELERILFPDKYQKISTYVEPDYPYIHRELAKPGVIAARREDDIVAAGIDMIHRLPEQLGIVAVVLQPGLFERIRRTAAALRPRIPPDSRWR